MNKPEYEIIVKEYIGLVYFFVKKQLNNTTDVDDVVQEVFIKGMKTYNQFIFKSEGELKSWLLTIARNTIIDSFRTKKNILSIEAEEIEVTSDENIEEWLELENTQKENKERIKKNLQQLQPLEQELIRLHIFEELHFKEIAMALDAKEGAVKMKYYRALQKLKKLYE